MIKDSDGRRGRAFAVSVYGAAVYVLRAMILAGQQFYTLAVIRSLGISCCASGVSLLLPEITMAHHPFARASVSLPKKRDRPYRKS